MEIATIAFLVLLKGMMETVTKLYCKPCKTLAILTNYGHVDKTD